MRQTERRFALTDEHIQLLRRMCVGWQRAEFGAPEIDPKRPYGNSDVLDDMAEILGVEMTETDDWGEPALTEADEERLRQLHRETETALQIVLSTGRMVPGVYVAGAYTDDWRPVAGVPHAAP
jgi:hypothetical protein